jgi:plasmid stabilization system protein ParE
MKVIWTTFSELSLLEIVNYIQVNFGEIASEK